MTNPEHATKDGLNICDLAVLYFVNKDEWRIDEYSRKELGIIETTVIREDRRRFDFMSLYLSPDDFYGSLSAAQTGLREELESRRRWCEGEIEKYRKLIVQIDDRTERLDQDTAILMKPVSNKIPELIGGCRV